MLFLAALAASEFFPDGWRASCALEYGLPIPETNFNATYDVILDSFKAGQCKLKDSGDESECTKFSKQCHAKQSTCTHGCDLSPGALATYVIVGFLIMLVIAIVLGVALTFCPEKSAVGQEKTPEPSGTGAPKAVEVISEEPDLA